MCIETQACSPSHLCLSPKPGATANLQACTPCHSQGLHVVQRGDRVQILSTCAGGSRPTDHIRRFTSQLLAAGDDTMPSAAPMPMTAGGGSFRSSRGRVVKPRAWPDAADDASIAAASHGTRVRKERPCRLSRLFVLQLDVDPKAMRRRVIGQMLSSMPHFRTMGQRLLHLNSCGLLSHVIAL